MRIALLTYSTRPRGGVVHTLALAEALAATGDRVEVWSLGTGGDAGFFREVAPNVRCRIVPFPEIEGEEIGPRITRSIDVLADALAGSDVDGADIVHAQDCLSANAALRVRDDVIRTVHHIDTFSTPELVACHERAIREPRSHICVSAAVAAELAAGWGIDARVIPSGVHGARYATAAGPSGAERRAEWQRRLGRYVLAVGGIEPREGTLDLVGSFATLARGRPDLSLVFAGGETLFDYRDYRAEVDRRAATLGVEPVLLGAVPDDDLPSLMAGAAVFAVPSTKEGFGPAAMEALAARVPVVMRDLPELREIYDGAVRFARNPGEMAHALGDALVRPQRNAELADRGSALSVRFTWSAAALAHRQLYVSLNRPIGNRRSLNASVPVMSRTGHVLDS